MKAFLDLIQGQCLEPTKKHLKKMAVIPKGKVVIKESVFRLLRAIKGATCSRCFHLGNEVIGGEDCE